MGSVCLRMVKHTCRPTFGEGEAGGPRVQGEPGQVVRPCLQTQT